MCRAIYHKQMLDINAFVFAHLFKLKTIQKAFVNAIGNTTAKSCCVVILFDLPDGDWVDGASEASIYTSCQVSDRLTFSCNSCQC